MAVLVVSALGGNIQDNSTWVGGVPPTSSDIITFTSLSGPLTITGILSTVLGIDLTNAVSNINFLADLIISGVGASVNLGTGGYTLSGTPHFNFTCTSTSTFTMTSNGTSWSGKWTLPSFTSRTITFTDDWTQVGDMFIPQTSILLGNNLYINGNLSKTGTVAFINVTTNIYFNGTTNISAGLSFNNSTANIYINGTTNIGSLITTGGATNLYFNGSVTINSNIVIGSISGDVQVVKLGGTLTLTSSSSTITITNSNNIVTLDLDITNLKNLTISNKFFKLILRSLLTVGTITISPNIVAGGSYEMIGTYGFICNTLRKSATVILGIRYYPDLIFKSNINYQVTDIISLDTLNIKSSIPGIKSNLILSSNINQSVVNCIVTDIDSSLGKRANTYYSSLSNCVNWNNYTSTTLPQVSFTF